MYIEKNAPIPPRSFKKVLRCVFWPLTNIQATKNLIHFFLIFSVCVRSKWTFICVNFKFTTHIKSRRMKNKYK